MAKKTRTELSTLAINTNLPDNTQELITPTTERAQLTDERESVVNYKDDLGGTSNAGKFLTVAVDGESLTMVDAPTGDVTGSGVQYQVAVWDGTNSLTGNAAFQFLTGAQNSIKLIRGTGSGNILFYAADGTTLHGYIENQVSGNGLTIGQQDGLTSAVIDLDDSTITFKTNNNPQLTITSGGAMYGKRALFDSDFLANETSKVGISFGSGYGQINAWGLNTSTYGGLKFQLSTSNGNTFNPLTIAPSGLATFTSGIQFGTGATLDAYEEGTWTPTIGGSGTFGTYSGTTFASYIRIGNQVMLNCYFNAFSVTGSTGDFVVRNLPYAPTGGSGLAIGSVMVHSIPNTGAWITVNLALGSATQLEFFQSFASGGWIGLPIVTGGSRYLAFSVSYTVQ